ncbi:MAG: exodeoxyribonuclease VII small subunit [Euryarchaeota archaeon]|nr:exodeoxyribonuclease VII small subunit [Euryarchaeota archaeon]|tara:strand:+ start:81709 stop:81903 length:195 start_codon:yes stop_codon:yes gene_type:complete
MMKYTEAMKRIEDIVSELESGGLSLNETLKMFEEGSDLLKRCREEIEQAEKKIDDLRLSDEEDA